MQVHHEGGYVLIDNWVKVKAAAQTAVLVSRSSAATLRLR